MLVPKYVLAQCSSCDIALAKDYFHNESSLQSRLDFLMMINKENYEQVKNDKSISWETGGNYLQIYSGFFNGGETWDEFQEKRNKFFQQFSYSGSNSQAQQETRLVTNKIAYNFWSNCITKCFENQEDLSKVYAYVTGADTGHIFLEVRYKATNTSKETQSCTITVENGRILNEKRGSVWPSSDKQKTFKIHKLGKPAFTIIREIGTKSTTISITADGDNVFRETIYFGTSKNHTYSGFAKYTLINRKDTFVRRAATTLISPKLFPPVALGVKILTSINRSVPGYFVRNGEDAVRNKLELPDLPIDQYYKNFSNVQCVTDNSGSCKWNIDKGLDEKINVTSNGQKAYVQFSTGYQSSTWKWEADVIQIIDDSNNISMPIIISDKAFVVSVPIKAKGAVILLNIDQNQYLITPGFDEKNLKAKLISVTNDGTYNYYSYFIKNE